MVVDAVDTWYTHRAELWVRPGPASDLALALGVIQVIVDEGLYDAGFVERWTVDFDKLREAVREATPEETERLTWVPAEEVGALMGKYPSLKPPLPPG